MKYTPYITILTVLLAAACAKQETVGEQQPVLPENAVSFSGTVSRGGSPMDASPDTKTIYEDMTEKLAVTWAEGDEVGIFCETGEENASVASNYGYRTAAAGATSAFVPMDSYNQVITWADMTTAHDFYAYYPYSPAQEGSTVDRHKVPVSLPSVQTFDASDPLGHLSDIDFMYASAVDRTADGGMVTFDFSYLFSVLEVRLTTSLLATVDAIELSCTEDAEAIAFEGATVDIETGALDMTGASVSSTIRLEGSQETSIGDYVSFFMLISPGHAGKTFDITAEIGGTPYTVVSGKAAPETGFAAGKTYVFDAGQVKIESDDATPFIDLSAGGTANCYYVTQPGMLYRFRADIKGNGVDPADGEVTIAPKSALVLWYTCFQTNHSPWLQESPIVIGSLGLESDGYIYFRTPETFVNGNVVVIAIGDDFDYAEIQAQNRQITNTNVLWSWNLVVTEGYDPNSVGSQFTKGGYTFMSRDLGAIIDPEQALIGGTWNRTSLAAAIGNCYQWGRKDPFPSLPDVYSYWADYTTNLQFTPAYTPIPALDLGTFGMTSPDRTADHQILGTTDETICMTVPSDVTTPEARIGLLIENPHIWMTLSGGGYLVPDDAGKAIWGNPENSGVGEKTMYDPCPPGWKVMSRDAWLALTDNLSNTVAKTDGIDGILVDDMYYFPVTGGLWRNDKGHVSGYAAGCGIPADSGYWFDGSYTDNKYGNFRTAVNFAAEGGDRSVTCSTMTTTNGANGASVRCIKINPGTAVPGGELDNFDKKDW